MHGYKYITLNADLSEYIIIFTSHLFICARMCVIFRHTDEASLLVVSARRLHRATTVVSARRLNRVATAVKGLIYVCFGSLFMSLIMTVSQRTREGHHGKWFS